VTTDPAAERARPPTLEDIEAVFSALAHEVRRHIVVLLGHSGGELPSGYLAKRFAHSWPTTTRHLRVLEDCGVVEVNRRGRSGLYRLKRERLQHVLGRWLANLEPASPTKTWSSSGPKSIRALNLRRSKGRRTP
jgi:DNA-binding transcriptional ArsR family regulator